MMGYFADSSNNNRVTYNTFKENRLSAVFTGCTTNIWDHNYWNRPRLLPKPILGYKTVGKIPVPWVNFDRNPAKQPIN